MKKDDNFNDLFDDKKDLPPLYIQLKNIIIAFIKVLKNIVLLKHVKSSNKIKNRRLEICKNCEHLIMNKRCSLCGCYVKPKASLLTEKCPDKRWTKNK